MSFLLPSFYLSLSKKELDCTIRLHVDPAIFFFFSCFKKGVTVFSYVSFLQSYLFFLIFRKGDQVAFDLQVVPAVLSLPGRRARNASRKERAPEGRVCSAVCFLSRAGAWIMHGALSSLVRAAPSLLPRLTTSYPLLRFLSRSVLHSPKPSLTGRWLSRWTPQQDPNTLLDA